MAFEIITDSSANLPESLIDELGIHIASLVFIVDGKEYRSYTKGEVTDLKQFYDMMREGKVVTTSQASGEEAKEIARTILESGKDVLYLGFSSGLSATFDAIDKAMTDIAQEYPERKVVSIDTLAAALGQGIFIYEAALMQQNGASIEEVAKWVIDNRMNVRHWFTVDDLMYLYRGGRVSRSAAFAGGILKIKPVLRVDREGKLVAMEKAKGRKKSIAALVDHFEECAQKPYKDLTIGINHADCEEEALQLRDMLAEKFGCDKFIINIIDPVIGAHTGPGLLGLFFMGVERP